MPLPSSGPLSMTDIQTEFGGTNPIGMDEYYAGGGLVPAGTTGTFGAVPSSGALSIQNFYGTSNYVPIYIEDVFSTWLYTGNGSTQTITNGIDLAGKGGLVWIKKRTSGAVFGHILTDTVRGPNSQLVSNSAAAANPSNNFLSAFLGSGFSVAGSDDVNQSSNNYVSWTFREQPKFFDVVTYTGDGVNGRTVAHNLGSTPGCIIVKRTSASNDWRVYHREMGSPAQNFFMSLNTTQARFDTATATMWTAAPTSTNFFVSDQSEVNASGQTYVAYLFAHDAGGFGLTGTDNVISCGAFTTNGSAEATVDLGYEPQWILVKNTQTAGNNWFMWDIMRGWTTPTTTGDYYLIPNSASAEGGGGDYGGPTARGFTIASLQANSNFIYIAIRRGPMKTPTSATTVFIPATRTGNGSSTTTISTGFTTDMAMNLQRNSASGEPRVLFGGRLLGGGRFEINSTNQFNNTGYPSTSDVVSWGQTNLVLGTNWSVSARTYVNYVFQRAPSFFDVVSYVGDGTSGRQLNHNLGVTPELMIVKKRDGIGPWVVYVSALGGTRFLTLNASSSAGTQTAIWNDTDPGATRFTLGNSSNVNESGIAFVWYGFATCPGVSMVGSFTGTGSTQVINCGFTSGARFVLIKSSSGSGNWFVWDSARGIVAGNDPYLELNTTTTENTGTDWVDTAASGFELSNSAGNLANSNGVNYIFLAIA